MKEKYYERLKTLSKDQNSSMLFWGYEASAILKEIERLHSIIKEVREKVESSFDNEDSYGDFEIHWELKKELLEILDKENKWANTFHIKLR